MLKAFLAGWRKAQAPPVRPPFPKAFTWQGHGGCVNYFEGAPMPVLRAFGWLDSDRLPNALLRTNSGATIAPLSASRSLREDVTRAGASKLPFTGFRID